MTWSELSSFDRRRAPYRSCRPRSRYGFRVHRYHTHSCHHCFGFSCVIAGATASLTARGVAFEDTVLPVRRDVVPHSRPLHGRRSGVRVSTRSTCYSQRFCLNLRCISLQAVLLVDQRVLDPLTRGPVQRALQCPHLGVALTRQPPLDYYICTLGVL